MQNKKTSLLCALLCLSVALPMLSGCRLSGPFYKTSSYHFYNPFSSKSRENEYDDMALAQRMDDPYYLPSQKVTSPLGGYSTEPGNSRINIAGNSPSRNEVDSRAAELARSSGSATTSGGASPARPQPGQPMFANNGSGTPNTADGFGTRTPIDSGFSGTGANQIANNQAQNPGMPYNPHQAAPQQPQMTPGGGYQADPNAWMYSGTPGAQPQINASVPYQSGQQPFPPANIMAQPGTPQYQYATSNDPSFGAGIPGTANPGTASIASTAGMGYGATDPTMMNPLGSYTQQPPVYQPTPQNYVMPNGMPSGGMPADNTGFGVSGYNASPNMGMPNPSATGTGAYSVYDPANMPLQPSPMQPTPQNQMPVYTGQPYPAQPMANSGYQTGFNIFGPTGENEYRPNGY